MKRFSQIFLLILASIGVITLGIFAYHLLAHTLRLAFVGQSHQGGQQGIFYFQEPPAFLSQKNTSLLDTNALQKSIFLNDTPYHLLYSGALAVDIGGSSIVLSLSDPQPSDSVKISAEIYNSFTKNPYRLPRDLIWEYENTDDSIQIIENTGAGIFSYEVISPDTLVNLSDEIKWYATHNVSLCNSDTFTWKAEEFFEVGAIKNTHESTGKMIYTLDVASDINFSCIIAGAGNNISVISHTDIPVFSFSGSVTAMRSPQLDMQTHLTFTTQSTLPEMPLSELIEKVQITPEISLTDENIALSGHSVDFFLPLLPDTYYSISLEDMPDIYGRTASIEYEISPQNIPSLSLALQGSGSTFSPKQGIFAQIFSSELKKSSYKIQVCKLEPSQYLRLQQHLQSIKENSIKTYNYISMHSPGSCIYQDIKSSIDQIKTPFQVDTLDSSFFEKGIYMLSFGDKDLLQNLQNFVEPQFFTVGKIQMTPYLEANEKQSFLVYDADTFQPQENIKVYAHIYQDRNMEQFDDTLPRVISLGISDENGKIIPTDGILEQLDRIFHHENMYWIFTLEGEKKYGVASGESMLFDTKKTSEEMPGNKNSSIYTSQYFVPYDAQMQVYGYTQESILYLQDALGENIQTYTISPQKDGFFSENIVFGEDIPQGEYTLSFSSKNVNIGEKREVFIGGKKIPSSEKMNIHFALQSNDFDDENIPKKLKIYENTGKTNTWYEEVFQAEINFEGIIQVADTPTGNILPDIDFTYQFFELDEQSGEVRQLTDGEGKTDADGFGYIFYKADFETYGSKKRYLCKISLTNPMTGEEVHRVQSMLASPSNTKNTFRDDIPLQFSLADMRISAGDRLDFSLFFDAENPSPKINPGAYEYRITLKNGDFTKTGSIDASHFSVDTSDFLAGMYEISLFPAHANITDTLRDKLTSTAEVLVFGQEMNLPQSIEIVPHKMQYLAGEEISFSVLAPQRAGALIVTANQGDKQFPVEYRILSGALQSYSFQLVSHSTLPFCIRAQLIGRQTTSTEKCLSIHTSQSPSVDVQLSKATFQPTENIDFSIQNTDNILYHTQFFLVPPHQKDNFIAFLASEKASLLTQKDLDVRIVGEHISYPTTHTGSLTLPDLPLGEYSLVALSNSAHKKQSIQSFQIHIENAYGLQVFLPQSARSGEKIIASVESTNTTESIQNFTLVTKILSGSAEYRDEQNLILNIGSKTTSYITIPIGEGDGNEIILGFYLKKDDEIIASTQKSISRLSQNIATIPQFIPASFTGSTYTSTGISTHTGDILALSVGSDISIFYEPLLRSLSSTPRLDDTTRLTYIFARETQSHIPLYLSGASFFPELDTAQFTFEKKESYHEDEIAAYINMLAMMLDLKTFGLQVAGDYQKDMLQAIQQYLKNHQDVYIYADSYRTLSRVHGSGAQEIFENIDPKKLDRHSRIAYIAGLQNHKKPLTGTLLDTAFESISGDIAIDQRGWSLAADRMILMQIFLTANEGGKAQEIFTMLANDFVNNPRLFSQREIQEGLRLLYLFSQKNKDTLQISWTVSSGATKIQNTLTKESPLYYHNFDISKIGADFSFSQSQDAPQILYSIFTKISKNPPQNQAIKIDQKIESIDIYGGMYPDGSYKKTTLLTDNTLEKNTLYKVTLEVKNQQQGSDEAMKYILHIPKSASIFASYPKYVHSDTYKIPFETIQENDQEFVAVYHSTDTQSTWKYEYYLLPRYSGEYILPAVSIAPKEQVYLQKSTQPTQFIIP